MTFLPKYYRESQTNWFAKRGISWHISVVVRKEGDVLEQQAFVHVVQNCSQESNDVVGILNHTLCALKKQHPEVKRAYMRQDNAGCYHSAEFLTSSRLLEKSTGIKVCRVDFSDPQGGKGPCDRKAATIKAHVMRYVNEGNDVTTAANLKEAILSHGGINGVRVAVIPAIEQQVTTTGQGKIDGISTLNNFKYSDDGSKLTVWKAYEIGNGKVLSWSKLQGI